jgi:uncharacterized protein (TIGR03118 family)
MRATSQTHRGAMTFAVVLALALCIGALPAFAAGYKATVLTADQTGIGVFTDPNLQNPWGVSFAPGGDWWVSDNNSGLSTLYIDTGAPQSLVVTIPPAPGGTKGTPTGTVYNSTGDFKIFGFPAIFIFATEDGTISGWYTGTSAEIGADESASNANYKGLEIGNNGTGNFLYAANLFGGTVDVFDKSFKLTTLSGLFHDPTLPRNFAPFNTHAINGSMYVLYAKQNASKTDATFCAGCGVVDVYDMNGNLKKHLIKAGGKLNAPWGIAVAPSNFGKFSKALLIGNLGDGKINAFNPSTGAFLGTLSDSTGHPLAFSGLWALFFGTGGINGPTNTLYYSAGTGGYAHGNLGNIVAQ